MPKVPIVEITALIGAIVALIGGIQRLIAESRENRRHNEKTAETLEGIKADVANIRVTADSNHELITKTANGTKTTLRYRLSHDMQMDIVSGYTTLERKRELAKLFEAYKHLDGNGEVEVLYHEYIELPLKEEMERVDNDAPI